MKPFIRLATVAKVVGIHLVDLLDRIRNPFDEFSRTPQPKYPETFATKAQRFEDDLWARFFYAKSIFPYTLPINTGDQCLFQGVTTAMLAMKYGVTGNADDLDNIGLGLDGMLSHQTVHGEAAPRLIRGWRWLAAGEGIPATSDQQSFFIVPGQFPILVEDWASNDSIAGHVLGIYTAWLYGKQDASIAKKTAILARGLADELLAHDFAIVDQQGNATPFGGLLQGTLTDPLRLATCLAALKVASAVTGDPKYEDAYQSVRKDYGAAGYAAYAKVRLWAWDNDPDTHRAAFLLCILADLDPTNKTYTYGLNRLWNLVSKSGNAWVALNVAKHIPLSAADLHMVKTLLSEISFEDKITNKEKINSTRTDLAPNKIITWGGHLRTTQPLPIWQRGAQEFIYQRNQNPVDDWVGNVNGDISFNGTDYLICYWFARSLGLIGPTE